MKLLLDENLSRRLIPQLQVSYPESSQVTLLNLEKATDLEIWEFAKRNSFVIVTKDADFYELSIVNQSALPKVIWIKLPNSNKQQILDLLLRNKAFIQEQLENNNKVCIELY